MSSINSITAPYLAAAKQAIANGLPPPPPKRAVIFHGNCCDGIGAAYLMSLVSSGTSLYFPVSPSDKRTWPEPATLGGYEIVFVDVCFPPEDMRLYAVVAALSKQPLTVFDHHPLATTAASECAFSSASITCTAHCATFHVWSHLYPAIWQPKWVRMLDDIDNWRHITDEHRALREVIHPIAKMAVDENPQKALMEMAHLINDRLATEAGYASVIAEGKISLDAKIASHELLLTKCPMLITKVAESPWPLPLSWTGEIIVVNTGRDYIGSHQFDTTLISEQLFMKHPEVNVFVNYHRSNKWIDSKTGEQKRKFVYHARARDGLDLTLCPVLKGHPSAAGGQEEEREGVPSYFVLP